MTSVRRLEQPPSIRLEASDLWHVDYVASAVVKFKTIVVTSVTVCRVWLRLVCLVLGVVDALSI